MAEYCCSLSSSTAATCRAQPFWGAHARFPHYTCGALLMIFIIMTFDTMLNQIWDASIDAFFGNTLTSVWGRPEPQALGN